MDHSLIPQGRKRLSLQAPLRPATTSPVQGRGHRRSVSTDVTNGRRSAAGRKLDGTAAAHRRLLSAVGGGSGASPTQRSTTSMSVASDGAAVGTLEDGNEECDVVGDGIDRIRAPTRSTLNKQRRSISATHPMPDARRRTVSYAEGQSNGDRGRLGLGHIPRAAVSHAVSMHGGSPMQNTTPLPEDTVAELAERPPSSSSALAQSPKTTRRPLAAVHHQPSTRIPSGQHGKSSLMIASLQADLEQSRQQFERASQEVRNCRREIGALTRRCEDLLDTKERMRAEAETQYNLIQRKDRIIADLLARARNAESSVTQHAAERKEMESQLRRTVTETRSEVAGATLARAKAESERDALRDSVKSLRDAWTREVRAYRAEVDQLQEQTRLERDAAATKREAIMTVVRAQAVDHKGIASLVESVKVQQAEASKHFEAEVRTLREEVDLHSRDAAEARETARKLALELARLRRFARLTQREDLQDAMTASYDDFELRDGSSIRGAHIPIP